MFRRKAIWLATALAVAVAATSFLGAANLLTGLVEATRETAQFSGLIFAIALLARAGFPRALGERRLPLLMAFVAAHGVHLAVVAARAAVEPGNQLRSFSVSSVLTVVVGLGLVSLAAFTARATGGVAQRANMFAVYSLWALFTLAFLGHAVGMQGRDGEAGAGLMFMVMLLAMAWRIAAVFIRPQPMAAAASSARS